MNKIPTQEQEDIISDQNNVVVIARPGSGKTFTITEKICKMLEQALDYQGVIAISFTNKASDELKKRCKSKGSNFKNSFFGTIDKFYISEIIIPFASHITGKSPKYKIVKEKDLGEYKNLQNITYPISKDCEALLLESLSKGIIYLEKDGEIALYILDHTPDALRYLKTKYIGIYIDEYQDCGDIQHRIFLNLVINGIVGMAVGDIYQAIFSFIFRYPKYLIELTKNPAFHTYCLDINHRCHKSISEYSLCLYGLQSNEICSDKRVVKVNIAGGEEEISRKIDSYLQSIKSTYGVINNNQCAILCHSNRTAQIMDNCLLTPHKIFVDSILDDNDSDWARLFALILKSYFDPEVSVSDVADRFISYEYDSVKYYNLIKKLECIFNCDSNRLIDIVNIFIEIADMIYPTSKGENAVSDLKSVLNSEQEYKKYKPAAPDEINIMTIHKSKGLEFNIVFQMDMYDYIFPKKDLNEVELKQQLNLHYVAVTRAIDACYLMCGTLRHNKNNKIVFASPSPFYSLPGLEARRREITL